MDNNYIYFSCFSLIRACVASLFDNFFKVVAVCLIVCFVLLSPAAAFASTTESMLMFSTGSVSDEYAVMPLSEYPVNNISLTSRVGVYNVGSDSFTSSSNLSSTSVSSNGSLTLYSPRNYYLPGGLSNRDYAFSEINFSNLSLNTDYSYRFIMNNFYMQLQTDASHYYQLNNTAFPFMCYLELVWNGSVKVTNSNTYVAHNGYVQRVPLSSVLLSIPDTGFVDIDFVVSPTLPTETVSGTYGGSAYTGNFVSGSVSSFKLVQIYPFSTNTWKIWDTVSDSSTVRFTSGFTSAGSAGQAYLSIISNASGFGSPTDNVVNSSTNSIVNTLNSSVNNITNQVNQVKTQITQSTNTITTKIDTMANDVKTGLQNVVTSAQQNTQNIINTVTQKVDQVKETVTEVKDSILDLPNKLQEMLTEFIVPDAETMGGKYSEFTELLEEKLGVIYQIPAMILELFETLVSGVTDPQTTLTFPSLSLPWIDGTQMKLWDSIEFEIIPTGMDVLKDLIQTVTSMVCVIMTFNSVKRIYENFLRGR